MFSFDLIEDAILAAAFAASTAWVGFLTSLVWGTF
jgi:hypothetical protein